MPPGEAAADTGRGVVGRFGGIGFLKPARCIPAGPGPIGPPPGGPSCGGGPGFRGRPWGGMGILPALLVAPGG